MKLQICSDLHLDDCTYGKIDKFGNTFRTLDHMSAFEWSVTQAIDVIHPDIFAITGDIYESPNPPNNVREFFNAQIIRLSKAGILLRIIVGNHDCSKFHSALQPLRAIPITGTTVYVEPTIEVLKGNLSGNTMLYLPYSLRVERKDLTQREHFMEMAASWREKAVELGHKDGDKIFFFGHFGVSGALMNDGYVNPGGDAMTLGDMEIMGADYSFLGDYHGCQSFKTRKGIVIIPGSLERTDFGDITSKKGFIVYDSEAEELEEVGKARQIEYPNVRKFIQIDGNEETIPETIEKRLLDQGSFKDSVVKVVFNGTVTGYRSYEFKKRGIKDVLEKEHGAIHVMFEDKQRDPEQDSKAEEIKDQIRKSSKLSEDDMEDIIRKVVKLELPDETESEKAIATALEIIDQVKSEHGKKESSKTAMAVRIHGIKMHNFLRYGDTDNIVELDVGAKEILSMPVKKQQWMKDVIATKSPELFLKWNSDSERRLISIVGMTDGDPKFSNGSGKSSCLEAISYAFFERLVREFADRQERKGVSTVSIVSEINGERKPEAFVELLFSADGAMWLLRRGRKSNKDGSNHSAITSIECLYDTSTSELGSHSGRLKAINNETIEALIGMNYDTFSNSVMFGQNDSGKFIKGTDKMKKDILMNVLHLWILEFCLERIREIKKSVAATLDSLTAQAGAISSITCDTESLEKQIVEIEIKLAQSSIKIEEKLNDINSLRETLSGTNKDSFSKDVKSIQDEMTRLVQDASSKKTDFSRRVSAAMKSKSELLTEKAGVEKEADSALISIPSIRKAIDNFNEAETEEELEKVGMAKEARPKRIAQASELTSSIHILSKEIGGIENEISSKNLELKKLQSLRLKCENGKAVKCSSCNSMVGLEHVDNEISKLNSELSILAPKINELKNKESELNNELSEIIVKIGNCDTYIAKEASLVSMKTSFQRNKEKIIEMVESTKKCEERILVITQKIKDLDVEIEDANSGASEIDKSSASEMNLIGIRLKEASSKLNEVESKANDIKRSIDSIDLSMRAEVSAKETLLSLKSRLETQIDDSKNRKQRVSDLNLEIKAKQDELIRTKVLEKAFGLNGIPSKIIERYLPLMNSYVAEYLDVISNHKIRACLSMDDSGETHMSISGEGASQSDLLSGGEFVKIKLAFSIALGMLSFVRSANTPEFICLDEIFAPVDIGTKDYVFHTIDKLKEHFRDILVISHDTSLLSRIKSSIVVNKVDGVSRIERQHHEKIIDV